MRLRKECPHCGGELEDWLNPKPTVDILIEVDGGIVFVERANEPKGWAIPGGFVDYGESLESAAEREAEEETGLRVELVAQLGAYGDPDRDPRHHTISVVYVARAKGQPTGHDDAARAQVFDPRNPPPLVFDHAKIVADYLRWKDT